ncbi:MAG: WYL domain-containing protein [Lachnospiraceae bacterium]|nr:WYL domain-containing protein [Lachnospiraceae bacterium]
MTEKYKIYIPEDMKMRLIHDAELFDFTKKDGSINLNAFLKELLVNYFDEYRERKASLLSTILADLNALPSISKKDADTIADKIINIYMKNDRDRAERGVAVTLTVSGRSLDVMKSIENNLLSQTSLSQYINDLLASYLSIARNKREEIIFRDTFAELTAAIRDNSIITFTSTSADDMVFTVMPYYIAASKEENCNYLICSDAKRYTRTFRISRLRALYNTGERFTPDEEIRKELQEIAMRNPQSASKNVYTKVLLTDRGIEKFHLITKNRPDVEKKDGNTYYFNWPKRQLTEYFKRFGYDALIISPADSRDTMRAFYGRSLDAYDRLIKKK